MINISEIKSDLPKGKRTNIELKSHEILNELCLEYEWVDNDEVSSMEECTEISEKLGAEIRKSIFLCNRQKNMFFLLIMPANKAFDTKVFSAALNVPRLSFASGELMEKYLGVLPGNASVMSLINDKDNSVQLVIDNEVAKDDWFGCNPGVNTSHIKIKTNDLIDKFLPYINHKPTIICL
ncbi:prolyl-tRNA synthetase associated domain-containing protein [Acetoanaerobium sticklandii]|uniref:prolyl-tRNA synthetase associated domain-containing protein n=1 Tax=Acetoanaerobium sticklandii TaxID=1511 RepID=UPI003A901332